MEHKIIFATGNEGKMREVRLILADLGMEVLSMKEAGVGCDAEENGATFGENARIKAMAVWEKAKESSKDAGYIVLADDSGLVVDYLHGEPGIYSARYLGEDTSYEIKNQVIIDRLAGAKKEERTARFVSAIAAVLPDGTVLDTEGTVEGLIAHSPAGEGGFGYDPIFYLPEYKMTSAQIPIEKKNEISHRGKALVAMKEKLKSLYGEEER
ncbi:MAG: RdgB/HAM1 family non-canonical purine NTP pyrophosphatase [Hungatella sp.]|nr:RdgB/HAM1 family non-canonical purine NTP pyrophosphatase [Hungatella sp.]